MKNEPRLIRPSKETVQILPRMKGMLFLMAVALALTGCTTVEIQEQRLVSKPSMQFSQSTVYSYSSRIMPQLQPGLVVSGGAQPSTCTVCR